MHWEGQESVLREGAQSRRKVEGKENKQSLKFLLVFAGLHLSCTADGTVPRSLAGSLQVWKISPHEA